MMQLGTLFAQWVAKPIARKIDGTFGTNVENCVACGRREQRINDFGEAVVNWLTNKKGDKMADENEKPEFLLQISVKAEDLREAISQVTGGKLVSGGPMPKAGVGQVRSAAGSPPQLPGQGQVIVRSQGAAQAQSGK